MVKAIIDISEESNQIFNIIKAKHGLRDKSEAINLVAEIYGEKILDQELRPKFVEEMLEIKKQKPIPVGSSDNLRKIMGLD